MKKIIEYTFEGKKELGIVGKATPLNEYDAYYLGNRYGKNFDCDLKEDFQKLFELKDIFQDDLVENALNWIHDCYDCYYKEDFEDPQDDNPFNHLQGLIDKLEE